MFDPLTATVEERYEKYQELAAEWGADSVMTESEAASVAGNFCDNDTAEMKSYVNLLVAASGNEIKPVLAQAAALASAYRPGRRTVVEGVPNDIQPGGAGLLPGP